MASDDDRVGEESGEEAASKTQNLLALREGLIAEIQEHMTS